MQIKDACCLRICVIFAVRQCISGSIPYDSCIVLASNAIGLTATQGERIFLLLIFICILIKFWLSSGPVSNYMSTEMFPFPRHVIIAQGNKLFHSRGDAVHADLLYIGFGPGSH